MLTFEKVIDVFTPYLDAMEYEIVKARLGYILLHVVLAKDDYDDVVYLLETPEEMKEKLLSIYEGMLLFQRVPGDQEWTQADLEAIAPEVQRMAERL